jgi:hypothetical protein
MSQMLVILMSVQVLCCIVGSDGASEAGVVEVAARDKCFEISVPGSYTRKAADQ